MFHLRRLVARFQSIRVSCNTDWWVKLTLRMIHKSREAFTYRFVLLKMLLMSHDCFLFDVFYEVHYKMTSLLVIYGIYSFVNYIPFEFKIKLWLFLLSFLNIHLTSVKSSTLHNLQRSYTNLLNYNLRSFLTWHNSYDSAHWWALQFTWGRRGF